jgi:hypothetical protein
VREPRATAVARSDGRSQAIILRSSAPMGSIRWFGLERASRPPRHSDGFKEVAENEWLGGRDSNPDTQIQSLETNFYLVGLLGTFPHPASPFCMVFGA